MTNGELLLPLPPPQAMPPMGGASPSPAPSMSQTKTTHLSFNLSPPLIAMVAVIGTAFLIILYTHVISHLVRFLRRRLRRRLLLPGTSPHPGTGTGTGAVSFNSSSDFFSFFSPYGLDETSIKNLPTSLFSKSKAKHLACTNRDCAVCLLEFEDNDSLRTLPYCSHAFHVECIDIWLRSHATCPLCRSSVTRPDFISYSPFIPMRASRIRPSLDDLLLYPPQETDPEISELAPIDQIQPSVSLSPQLDSLNSNRRENFFLKRSYSFGFERGLASERMMVLEPSTASPWRFRHNHHHHRNSFWSKRFFSSPFTNNNNNNFSSSSRSSRVFSFRSSRKSPLTRRRAAAGGSLFFPLSAGPSSRRTRSMTTGFYSSRMRCGDPEALLSPERLVNR
ncbi:hypothetical protein LUZ60_004992 [Juncus effusus]|nr:hypothetical protein LUZ60_004992 [Juncus effusus]